MNRKSKVTLVSSTPHVKRTATLTSLFENEAISPIVPKILQGGKAAKLPLNKPVKLIRGKTVNAIKKKCPPTKEKESASSAVLKELGVKMTATSTNILSISRQNMYNCYPEPIILVDSDGEPDSTVTKHLPQRKTMTTKPSTALSIQSKNVEHKNIHQKTSEVSSSLKKGEANMKEKKPVVSNGHETPPASSSRPRVSKKRPLNNLANTNSPRSKLSKIKAKQTVEKHKKDQSVLCLDSNYEDTIPVNISSVRKKNYLKFTCVEDVLEDDAIRWTPRSKVLKRTRNKKEASESELENSDGDNCKVLNTVNVVKTLKNSLSIDNSKENIDKNTINVPIEKEPLQQKETLPKDLSRFCDLVFKPSIKHKGCVIASSLKCGSLEVGFLEIEAASDFTGIIPNITFVLLEGQVKASFRGKTQNMVPGDILHVHEGSGYMFENLQSIHARLQFIKDKRHS